MKRFMFSDRPYNLDLGLLILRIFTGGFLLAGHGWPKVTRLMDGNTKFVDPIGLGEELSFFLMIFAEIICAVLIIIGFMFRPALLAVLIGMSVVVFVVHGGDPILKRELVFIYLANFTALFLSGPGKYSIDGRR